MKALQSQGNEYSPPVIQRLYKLAGADGKSGEWLEGAEASIEFLKENVRADRIVLYANMPHVLIHGVLAPLKQLKRVNASEFAGNFIRPDESWCIDHVSGGGNPDRVFLSPPMGSYGGVLENGEKLIFRRTWPRATGVSTELSQRLVHALQLHYVEEGDAYCRIDELGDVDEVIKIIDEPSEQVGESVCVVTISGEEFFEYARLADMGVVFFFDFTRNRPESFTSWPNSGQFERDDPALYYHGCVAPGVGSYINGRQIVLPPIGMRQIVRRYQDRRDPKNRPFATFKAVDLRTSNRIEVSCDPDCLSNYFEPGSDLPLEMSPAYFRAEVLQRYKADPEKYELDARSILCPGAWELQTYDVNEVGQVHTYLRYLGSLPYQEQLYWQSFNEWPRGPLSSRAVTTDFEGRFSNEYDPLQSVKHKVEALDRQAPAWWIPRGKELARVVHEPVTNSIAEWADAILALDQLVVEGFREKALRALASTMGFPVKKIQGSINLLQACLIEKGVEEDEAKKAAAALRTVHHLRTVLRGHAAPAKKAAEAKRARKTHGSFRAHFSALAAECDQALRLVMEKLK